jgi:rhodanese-related sulfurtransferase
MKTDHDTRPTGDSWLSVMTTAAVVGLLFSGLGLAVNALRADGIELVAKRDYEILVPCPEPLGEVFPMEPQQIGQEGALVIDAREPEEFSIWHWADASNIPFDFLDPVPGETVKELIRTRARLLVVYGDGDDPDSGRELARELAGRGARNVYFVPGGAQALRQTTEETP